MENVSLIGIAAAKGPLDLSVFQVKANELVTESDGVNVVLETKDVQYDSPVVHSIFPAHGSCRSVEGIYMPDLAIGPYNHKLVGDEWVSMKLALFSVLANVIVPLQLPGFLVECADHAVAGTYDKQVTHDRRRRENSAAGIELPKNRFFVGVRRRIRFLGRD